MIGEALIGFLEVGARFLRPVFLGDTLYPALAIVELIPQRSTGVVVMRATIYNQHDELVLEGSHKYLLRLTARDET